MFLVGWWWCIEKAGLSLQPALSQIHFLLSSCHLIALHTKRKFVYAAEGVLSYLRLPWKLKNGKIACLAAMPRQAGLRERVPVRERERNMAVCSLEQIRQQRTAMVRFTVRSIGIVITLDMELEGKV